MNHKRSISLDKRTVNSPRHLPTLSPGHRYTPSLISAELLPMWLLKRTDFQKSLQERDLIKNFNIRNLSPTPSLYSNVEKKALNHYLSQFTIFQGIWKSIRKKFLEVSELALYSKGEIVEITRVHFIISGIAQIDDELKLGPYNIIGNNSILLTSIREYKCLDNVTIISISFADFANIFPNYSIKSQIIFKDELSRISYFSTLNNTRMTQICEQLIPIEFSLRQPIFEIGDCSKYAYLSISGDIEMSSLVTVKTINKLPIGKKIRETLVVEKNYAHILCIIRNSEIFGHKEAIEGGVRLSRTIVISSKCRVYAFNWENTMRILTEIEKEAIQCSLNPKETLEVNMRIKRKLKDNKMKLKALLEASEITQRPRGRETFEELSKRKRLYANALESSFHKEFKDEFLGCKYLNSKSVLQ